MVDDSEAAEMLREHSGGSSYRAIGRKHQVSHEQARLVVVRQARKYLDGLELSLAEAWKLERLGRENEAAWPVMLCPHGPDWSQAIAFLQWTVDKLRARDLDIHVKTQATQNGSAFMLILRHFGSN